MITLWLGGWAAFIVGFVLGAWWQGIHGSKKSPGGNRGW